MSVSAILHFGDLHIYDDADNMLLDDTALLARESSQREEFLRLERLEPQLRDTTYRAMRGSSALLIAYSRWTHTSVAARLRGLQPRRSE